MQSFRHLGLALVVLASSAMSVNADPHSKPSPAGYTVCTNHFAPVCGANGISYYNGCHAKAAGTRVSAATPCMGVMTPPQPPKVIDRQVLPPQKIVVSGEPVRRIVSTERMVRTATRVTCENQQMVCGVDDRTYATVCDANTAGIEIKRVGPCHINYVDVAPVPTPIPNQPSIEHSDVLSPIEVIIGEEVPYDKPVVQPKPRKKHNHKHRHVIKHKHPHGKGHHHSRGCHRPKPVVKPAPKPATKPVEKPQPKPQPAAKPEPKPEPVWSGQICGSDDYTYHTVADAKAGGITVKHKGPCKSSINIEQAPITTTAPAIPSVKQCPDINKPVCGVDNFTYQSSCDAKRSGIVVKHTGSCAVKPATKPVVKPLPPVVIPPAKVTAPAPAHCTPAPAPVVVPQVTKPVVKPEIQVIQQPKIRFHGGCSKCARKKAHKHHDYGQHRNHGKIISRKVLAGVNFTTASADLSKGARHELQQFAHSLENHNVGRIRIAGHTDNQGSERLNRKLSKQRAREVANYLTLLGLPADKMIIRGLGSRHPIASNDDVLGRAKNRRVSITVYAR